jgi:hypothetical protein
MEQGFPGARERLEKKHLKVEQPIGLPDFIQADEF